jgi:8-oxo-dGTP pyrophosphatase MutT (NUDIX family)
MSDAERDQVPGVPQEAEDVPRAPEGARAVKPRPAASLLVVRHTEAGPQLVMARRSPHHRFMPNVLVFPGGAVDQADFQAPAATELRDDVRARLERSAVPDLARALAAAAARELEEEVGLTLGTPPALHGLDYMCRAITPPDRAMRFDAYFFAVDASHVSGTLRASEELEEPGWYSLEQALGGQLAGATKAVLWQFRTWLQQNPRGEKVAVLRDRQWVEE